MPKRKKTSKTTVTSKDVAALAGVSQSTVSRVLSSNKTIGMISKETAKRVREAAEQLDYSPNPIARALRGELTKMIGLIVREISDPFFAGLIGIIIHEAKKEGFNVILSHAHSDPTEGLQMARVLDSRQCDATIFLGDLLNDKQMLQSYVREKHPAVALCRGRKIPNLATINCDNRAGINLLIEHLLGFGHKRLIYIDGGWFGDILERRMAFLQYKEQISQDFHFNWLQAEDNDSQGGYKAMQTVMGLSQQPTAILASDDALAIGILKAANDAGLNIPKDVSVTGFDDIEFAKYSIPGLTTIRQPIEEMGTLAVMNLMTQLKENELPDEDMFIEVKPELIIRDSTGKAKKIKRVKEES